MAISRGSIRHRILENMADLAGSIIRPRGLLSASEASTDKLKKQIQKLFPQSSTSIFPYARTALHAVLSATKLPAGSKVLMTPLTIAPMIDVITSLGYVPVFVDIETDTYGPNLSDLHQRLHEGASVFLLTHLFGYVSELDKIMALCGRFNVFVIEDISHNIGSYYRGVPLGQWGNAAIYSASLLKYVDGYNGAFTLSRDSAVAGEIELYAKKLRSPNKNRIRKIIIKTATWNLALNRYVFHIITYPLLSFIKKFNEESFEKIVGPGINASNQEDLPSFYFESCTELQCVTMERNLRKLAGRIEDRRVMAGRLTEALVQKGLYPSGSIHPGSQASQREGHTYWQFVLNVRCTTEARGVLFSNGVETGTTNLRDLAHERGLTLPGAKTLKTKSIFIPLHDHLQKLDYLKIINCLDRENLLHREKV